MINYNEIMETIKMISEENLDIRTITMGISLMDCIDSDINKLCDNIYDKITKSAENLVATGEDIEHKYGMNDFSAKIESMSPFLSSMSKRRL